MRVIDEALLARFRGPGRCDYCKKQVRRREPHHLFSRGAGRIDIAVNIAALCATFTGGDNCHAQVHQGGILPCDVLAVVAAREGLLQDDIRRMVWAVRRAPKGSDLKEVLEAAK